MGEAQRAVQVLASLVNLRFYLQGFVPGPSGNFKSKGLLKPTGKKGTSWVLEFWGHHLSARPGPGVGKPVLLHAAGHWGGGGDGRHLSSQKSEGQLLLATEMRGRWTGGAALLPCPLMLLTGPGRSCAPSNALSVCWSHHGPPPRVPHLT